MIGSILLEQPSPQTAISRIDLKHVMNTYTNYEPTSLNNPFNFDQNVNNPNYATNFGNQYTPVNSYPPSNSFPSYPPMMLPPPFPTHTTVATTTTTTTKRPVYEKPISPASNSNNDLSSICGTRHSETEITPLIFGE